MPGFSVSPVLIFKSVVNGTPEEEASAFKSAPLTVERAFLSSDDVGIACVMPRSVPQTVWAGQPLAVRSKRYFSEMTDDNPIPHLWGNICELMGSDSPSLDDVASKTGVGRGTVQRIKNGETNIQTKNLAAIARAFGLSLWQLMVKDLKRGDLPSLGETRVINSSPLTSEVVAKIANLPPRERMKLENRLRLEFDLEPLAADQANDTTLCEMESMQTKRIA